MINPAPPGRDFFIFNHNTLKSVDKLFVFDYNKQK